MRETLKLLDITEEVLTQNLSGNMDRIYLLLTLISCGILAYIISIYDPAFDALFLALIFGIIAGNLQNDDDKKRISERLLVILIPLGITLYGLNINIPYLGEFDPKVVFSTFAIAVVIFVSIIWFSKIFKLSRPLSILLACGSSICGASAIAIVSPLLKPRKEEFSAAIIIISVVGLTGAVLYPSIAYFAGITPAEYAVLSGATLPQTGIVKISSKFFGVEEEALAVKGIRIAMIALVALILSILYSESRFYVPWYIVTFLGVALFATTYLSNSIVMALRPISTITFSITLATIGYSVNLRKVQRVGIVPLLVSYSGWCLGLVVFVALLWSDVI